MSSSSTSTQKINRMLRYKELIEKGAEIGETIDNQHCLDSLKSIKDLIDSCENVSTDYAEKGKVENAAEFLLDASIIKMSHDLMHNTAEKMSDNSLNEDEYVAALLNAMNSNQNENVKDKILEIAAGCCKTVSIQPSLLGTFAFDKSLPPKVDKLKRERHVRSKLEAKMEPENVSKIIKTHKGAEKINIIRSEIERVCKERRVTSIPYFEAVIDPHDFMKTIDAAFQLSFLIRDNIFGVKRINREPHIVLKDSILFNEIGSDQHATVQTVMSLDPPLWRKEAQKYNLKEPILKLNYSDNDSSSDSE